MVMVKRELIHTQRSEPKQLWVGEQKKAVKFDPVLDEKQKVSF
jgi:hypothetical protein